MEENDMKEIISFFSGEEVKVVWREEEKTKVGRGKITHDDINFVYLAGEKGKVVVNKKDVIAIKQ
jgi:RNase P/RNase MRP subunit p29